MKSWQVPRSDKRDRCGKCFKILHFKDNRFRDKRLLNYRFPTVCTSCRKITLQDNTKEL